MVTASSRFGPACAFVLTLLAAAAPASRTHAADADRAEIEAVRSARIANLRSESGWLALVGLAELRPGANTFGRARTNRAVVDYAGLPDRVGTFTLRDARVRFAAARGVAVSVGGAPVREVELASDRTGSPTVLEYGTVQLFVIERAGRHLVRVRDRASPRVLGFGGIEYFPIADAWVLDARFEPYTPERTLGIVNVLGYEEQYRLPGRVVFTKDGREWALDAVISPGGAATELFLIFADGTTGRETYGAGRYLYTELPRDGRVRVDFNRAINPPCAFNDFATCPLPPQQNRIALRIEAGEKTYAAHP